MVESHTFSDLHDIRTGHLADVRDLVDEADPRREESIGGELDHLRRGDVRPHKRRLELLVEGGHPFSVRLGERADHDAIRAHEVLDGRAFGQELRVRHVADVAEPTGLQRGAHLLARADGHRALHDEDRPPLELG